MKQKLIHFLAWLIPISVGIGILYITFGKIWFDARTWADYLNTALAAKLINLLLFYGSIILFDFAFPPPGLTMVSILESSDAWKFYSILAVSTAYIIGLT